MASLQDTTARLVGERYPQHAYGWTNFAVIRQDVELAPSREYLAYTFRERTRMGYVLILWIENSELSDVGTGGGIVLGDEVSHCRRGSGGGGGKRRRDDDDIVPMGIYTRLGAYEQDEALAM